jgi:hypothetical protein
MAETMERQAELASFDLADFAQEFLRRNPLYRAQYAGIADRARADPCAPSCREMARSWGLVFPDPA